MVNLTLIEQMARNNGQQTLGEIQTHNLAVSKEIVG